MSEPTTKQIADYRAKYGVPVPPADLGKAEKVEDFRALAKGGEHDTITVQDIKRTCARLWDEALYVADETNCVQWLRDRAPRDYQPRLAACEACGVNHEFRRVWVEA